MVADKENRASNTLVRTEVENQDVSYSQAAQEVFSSFFHYSGSRTDPEKKDQDEMQMKLAKKRLSQLMEVEDSNKPLDAH